MSVLLLCVAFLFAGTSRSEAQGRILIFKVTYTGKAKFLPKLLPDGNGIKITGYLIYDTAAPANSQTLELFSDKTYEVNTRMLTLIAPDQVIFSPFDKNNDGFPEIASALVGFTVGNDTFVARSYTGTNPRVVYKVGGQFFSGPRSVRGIGSVTVFNEDHYTISDTWTLDPLSGVAAVYNSINTNDGLTAVKNFVEARHYRPF